MPSKCPGLFNTVREMQKFARHPPRSRISSARAMPCSIIRRVFSLMRYSILGAGNAVTVLQFRIQRDAIVLFRQVLAGDTDAQPVTVQLTEDVMVFVAPWQTPSGHAIDRPR